MGVRVLCYSPYNRWPLHGQWEMTVLQALKQRGAEVQYVLCDGVFTDCDVHWAAIDPRTPQSCFDCQASVTKLVAELGMEWTWLGRYLQLDEPREARRWEQSLAPEELDSATYGDWPVAEWVRGSVHSHLRRSVLDVTDPVVEQAWRSYLYSGLVACMALDRLLDDSRPDVMLQFNGRQSSTRVAFELARRRGIRVVCHERGYRAETLRFIENASCAALQAPRRLWQEWGEIPLSRAELEAMQDHLLEREHGRGHGFVAFAPDAQPVFAVREELGLDPRKPLWVLFTSSDDEVVAEAEYRGAFTTQLEWIERTVAYAAEHPEMELVIRVHPNSGSRRSMGANTRQLEELERVAETLPANARIVRAEDDVSSYALMELSTVALVYHSLVGLEAATKGKAVVAAGGSLYSDTPFVRAVDDAERYEALLDDLLGLPAGGVDVEVRRLAYRFAYATFFRNGIPFPLVTMPDPHWGVVQWSSVDDLLPGLDVGLDRCTRILLDGEPACPPPSIDDRLRTLADENGFLRQGVRKVAALAYAHELVEDDALLAAWSRTFTADDDVTLVIQTPPEATEDLIAAVGRAGMDREGAPDLVAIDGAAPVVDVVFSRRDGATTLPRYDDASIEALRALAA